MIEKPVILFDGVCNFCNHSVQQILKWDRKGLYQFASLQGDFGQNFLKENHLSPDEFDSILLVQPNGSFSQKSEAALEIIKSFSPLTFALSLILKRIPINIRDKIYDLIAENRYLLFGKKDQCMAPKPEWRDRFLA